MTAPSPADQEPALLRFDIRADGQAIDSDIQVSAIETWSSINKVPRARLVILDGEVAERDFPVSDAATFIPGKAIDISAGYGNSAATIFSGIVVAHSLEIKRNSAPVLIVDMADKAVKMTVARNSSAVEEKTDSDFMSKLLGTYGLSSDVASTSTTYPAMVQFTASDWDTLLYRAEMNGMVVTTEAGKVTVKAPATDQQAVLRVAFGESVLDFEAELNAVGQLPDSAVKSYAWDLNKQELLTGEPSNVVVVEPGNLPSKKLAEVCNTSAFAQLTGALVTKADLVSWSSARLARAKLAKVRGRVRFQGNALVKPGSMITLQNLGDRFNGNVFVSGVHHEIKRGRWYTTVDFGLAADWFASNPAVAAAPALHVPPIKGLHTAVVVNVAEDPAGNFRVQVKFPYAPDVGMLWARLGSFYASKTFGAVFYPEVDDEVIVGFMNEDPRFPVILGSVYSKTHAPSSTPEAKNNTKALVTRSKLELSFDDDKKVIVLKTPGGHTVTMDDDKKSVTIVDSNSNGITLDSNGITLDSPKNITIKATGNISLEATGNLTMKATSNASLEGMQVSAKAQAAFSAEGSASAELKASGMVTVQGGLVKIN
jgi:Rhs element Vgr protein